ncbi:MAG TPA: hypothetical protein VIJ06_00090 [Methylovirgula sp.]
MTLTRDDVISVLGPVDDSLVAEILATGASLMELEQAWAWLNADAAQIDAHAPLPTGRAARLVDILSALDDEQ